VLGGLYVVLGWGSSAASSCVRSPRLCGAGASPVTAPLHKPPDSYLFSAHMVQHLVLTLVFPPLLLYGTPASVVGRCSSPAGVRFARRATRPLAAGVLFSATDHAMALPAILPGGARAPSAAHRAAPPLHRHRGDHVVAVLSPVPELPRASYPTQLGYLFLLGFPMSPAGAMITLSEGVLYPFLRGGRRACGASRRSRTNSSAVCSCGCRDDLPVGGDERVWFRVERAGGIRRCERVMPVEAYSTPLRPSRPSGCSLRRRAILGCSRLGSSPCRRPRWRCRSTRSTRRVIRAAAGASTATVT